MMDEQKRADLRWQWVTCSGCGRRYQCTPSDDYYSATTTDDGTCTRCLIGNLPLVTMELPNKDALAADPASQVEPDQGDDVEPC